MLFIFVEPGKRTLRFPFQKDWTIGRLLDFVECIFGSGVVVQASSNSPLNQQWINLVAAVLILAGLGEGIVRVTLRDVELVGLLGEEG